VQQTHVSNIRKVTEEDLLDLSILSKQFAREAKQNGYNLTFEASKFKESFLSIVNHPDYFYYLAEVNGDVVGFFLGAKFQPLFSADVLAVEMFWWLEKEHRGNRVSLKMLKAFEVWAKETGASEVSVSDLQGVKNLDSLYKRLGYTKSEVTYKKDL